MIKVRYRKGKKYIIVEGREFGAISLYYYIRRTISTYKSMKEIGVCGEERLIELKNHIGRYIKIYNEYYPEEAGRKLAV